MSMFEKACKVMDQAAADVVFEELVERNMELTGNNRPDAESVIRNNLGYMAASIGNECLARVEAFYKCVHPVIGATTEKEPPNRMRQQTRYELLSIRAERLEAFVYDLASRPCLSECSDTIPCTTCRAASYCPTGEHARVEAWSQVGEERETHGT